MEMQFSLAAHLLELALIFTLVRRVRAANRELARLRDQCQIASASVEELGADLDGLCAAAVHEDRKLLEQDQRIRRCAEALATLQERDTASSPYHGAIELIRQGADAHDVANRLGVSLSEAELLVRLNRAG